MKQTTKVSKSNRNLNKHLMANIPRNTHTHALKHTHWLTNMLVDLFYSLLNTMFFLSSRFSSLFLSGIEFSEWMCIPTRQNASQLHSVCEPISSVPTSDLPSPDKRPVYYPLSLSLFCIVLFPINASAPFL